MNPSDHVAQARARKMADALACGIDDAFISHLVEQFYEAIRADEMLGPIFGAKVTDWPSHLARMKDFWASIAIESGRFHGNPVLKHIAIPDLSPEHFESWLALWDEAVAELVPIPTAEALFRDRARRIAASLKAAIQLHRGGLAALTKEKKHAIGA